MEDKVELQPQNALHALATTTVVVGAMVNGKPNYLLAAWACPASFSPPALLVVLNKAHFTNEGIRASKAFSVSVFRPNDIVRADFTGMKSGHDTDKSAVFKSVPGKKTGAPLLPECPLTIELSLMQVVEVSATHELFIGKVESIFASHDAVDDGKIDASKLQPVLFTFSPIAYRALGQTLGQPWSAGAAYTPGATTVAATTAAAPQARPLPHVDASACVGCGTCCSVCPHELYEMDANVARFKIAQKDDCTNCGECVHNCAASAITIQ